MSQVKSFSDILSLFDEDQIRVRGTWFLVPEPEVIKANKASFGAKPGLRRVILWRSSGPNSIVYPRTSSGKSGISHEAHSHDDFQCKIDLPGRVTHRTPCTVQTRLLNQSTYCCIEPDKSLLVDELQNAGSK